MSNRERIVKLFKAGKTLFYFDIADKTGIDLQEVVGICEELMREGKIRPGVTLDKRRRCEQTRVS